MEPLTITPAAAAQMLGVSRTTVYRMMNNNQLPIVTVGVGRRRKIHRARLIEQIDAGVQVADTQPAPGVFQGERGTCHIDGKTRLTGGSALPHRTAAKRLESLLER